MEKHSVTDRVAMYLRQNIGEGVWPVGSKLPSEKELCRQTGASRTSVRRALQKFIMLGLLQSQRGSGTYVRSLNVQVLGAGRGEALSVTEAEQYLLNQWNQARLVLEPTIAYYAAEHATPELISDLERLNEEQRAAVGDQEKFIQVDMAFHMALVDSLHNSYLSNAMKEILEDQPASRLVNDTMGYLGGVYYHAAITDAIKLHDATKAKRIMEEHAQERLSYRNQDEE